MIAATAVKASSVIGVKSVDGRCAPCGVIAGFIASVGDALWCKACCNTEANGKEPAGNCAASTSPSPERTARLAILCYAATCPPPVPFQHLRALRRYQSYTFVADAGAT